MKKIALIALVSLLLIFSGCVEIDEDSEYYNAGVRDGENNKKSEIKDIQRQMNSIEHENNDLESDLEDKAKTTKDALNSVAGLTESFNENNELLAELVKEINYLDLNLSQKLDGLDQNISDLNANLQEVFGDLNKLIYDINTV